MARAKAPQTPAILRRADSWSTLEQLTPCQLIYLLLPSNEDNTRDGAGAGQTGHHPPC